MSAQSLENYNREGTGGSASRRTFAREEYALVAAAKRGDSAAFEILCKQWANTVFRVARQMMRNNEDAEDVVQESFQQAFIHLNSFNGDDGASPQAGLIQRSDGSFRGCPALPSMLP